ncbi:uncharacterized protein [Leuresthes tenuis]|uniref:uncharacterized protein n=1 Tax=Leuresthes tenuis TaxID=355514 RepID=UPI003B500564
MMLRLFFLSACVCVGLSYDTYAEVEYGNRHRMRVQRTVRLIEFVPTHSSNSTILWKQDDPEASEAARRRMVGRYYMINNVTQRDSGQYILRDRGWTPLSTKTVEVVANTRTLSLTPGEQLRFTFDLPPNSCNIYFFPEGGDRETQIVRHGRLLDSNQRGCAGSQLLKPCGILNEAVQESCAGHFEIRDNNDDTALRVSLEIKPSEFNSSYLMAGGGAFLFALLSCCLKHCCCGKSSKKKNGSEFDDAAAAEHSEYYQEYDHEPVGPRPNQHTGSSEAPNPTQPSQTLTGPLIHNPQIELLPAYSEVSAPAERADSPTVLLYSPYEPRFEVKGINFNSDTPHSDVYTSDKLNFL